MSVGSDTTWVGKKPLRRIGGMSDALSVAADLGFSVAAPPSQASPSLILCHGVNFLLLSALLGELTFLLLLLPLLHGKNSRNCLLQLGKRMMT
uniref:Uncharacterized protein MANES_13G066400 n=1 Tax=Rhizophora mucronata TaxID=61149 RepID=A0A2P2PS98_RHIMU